MEDLIGFGFVGLVIAFVIGAIVWSNIVNKKTTQEWIQFAKDHGLRFSPPRSIQGTMDGLRVRIGTVTRGSGKNRTTYTQIRASSNQPVPSGLNLYRETMFSKVGKMFGGEEITIGDRAFDEAFIIKGTDVRGVRAMLSVPQVRQGLMIAINRHPSLAINGNEVLIEVRGTPSNRRDLQAKLADAVRVAQTMDQAYYTLTENVPPVPKSDPVLQGAPARAAEIASPPVMDASPLMSFESMLASQEAESRSDARSEIADARREAERELEDARAQARRAKDEAIANADHFHGFGFSDERLEAVAREDRELRNDIESSLGRLKSKVSQAEKQSAEDITREHTFDANNIPDQFHVPKVSSIDDDRPDDDDEAFQEPDAGDVFKVESSDVFSSSSSSWSESSSGFSFGSSYSDSPDSNKSPDPDPAPATEQSSDSDDKLAPKTQSVEAGDDLLIDLFTNEALSGADRAQRVEEASSTRFTFTVDRVGSTFGFDTAESMKDGRTVDGLYHADGEDHKVSIRFPKSRNDEIDRWQSGDKKTVTAFPTKWDDLFKKAEFDAL